MNEETEQKAPLTGKLTRLAFFLLLSILFIVFFGIIIWGAFPNFGTLMQGKEDIYGIIASVGIGAFCTFAAVVSLLSLIHGWTKEEERRVVSDAIGWIKAIAWIVLIVALIGAATFLFWPSGWHLSTPPWWAVVIIVLLVAVLASQR